jgi:hypothetical protein
MRWDRTGPLAMLIYACEHLIVCYRPACPEGDLVSGLEVSAPPKSRLQA